MSSAPQVVRVVVLGKTGAGKSSLGNTLLGRDDFLAKVTDTPGVADTDPHRKEDEVLKEVSKSIAVASPGPHVIIMMLRCDMRFTKEEYVAYRTLKMLFGDDICKYMIVVFAGVDAHGEPQEREKNLTESIQAGPKTLKEVLDDAGGRYCTVNNKASGAERDQQARTIILAIKNLVAQNQNAYFTSQLCEEVSQQVEAAVQHRMETSHGAVTHGVAVRDTRQDILAERVEPSFWTNILKIVRDAVLSAISIVIGASAQRECSVM